MWIIFIVVPSFILPAQVHEEDYLVRTIMDAVQVGGKTAIVELAQQCPNEVRMVLKKMCNHDHLLHRACCLGDEELVTFLTCYCADINADSPLVKLYSLMFNTYNIV